MYHIPLHGISYENQPKHTATASKFSVVPMHVC